MGSPPTRLLFVLQALSLFVHVASAVYCTDARMRNAAVRARDPTADMVIDKKLTTLSISSQLLIAPVGSPVVQNKHSDFFSAHVVYCAYRTRPIKVEL